VDVSVRLATLSQAVTVPREGVNIGQNGNYVFVVDSDNKAQMRPVTVLYQDQVIAAIGSGVKPGDRVVTDGQLRITPGINVLITQPDAPASANQNGSAAARLNEASSDSPEAAVKVSSPAASGGRGG
jgi:multidrug efflux system membrane fusion protein